MSAVQCAPRLAGLLCSLYMFAIRKAARDNIKFGPLKTSCNDKTTSVGSLPQAPLNGSMLVNRDL